MSKKAIYPIVYFLGYGLSIGLYVAIMASHNWAVDDSFLVKVVTINFMLLVVWALGYPILFPLLFPEFFTRYVIGISDDPKSLFRMIKTKSFFRVSPGEVISQKIVVPDMTKLLSEKLTTEEKLIQTCLVFGLKSNLQEILFPWWSFYAELPILLGITGENLILMSEKATQILNLKDIIEVDYRPTFSLKNWLTPGNISGFIGPHLAVLVLKFQGGQYVRLRCPSYFQGWPKVFRKCADILKESLA